ncbi:MAG: hypothetical protein JOY77_11110 [Alphaproteobacteria bacterium]|nr:hypothetical protein [Alphaproteobacteria bacterium]MBV9063458.1 hypothetical protein [Alphaproteobacteria bacterium]
MHRFYFNFRKGDEVSVDRRGMWFADASLARREAIQLWGTLLVVAMVTGDPPEDCEYEIANDNGETVAVIPLGSRGAVH